MTDRLKNSGGLTAFKLSDHHIHIFKGDVRLGVVNCEEQISAHCIEEPHKTDEGQTKIGSVWLASGSGRIYHVDGCSIQHPLVRIDPDDNQDIFNTLLASQAPGGDALSTNQNQDVPTIIKLNKADCKVNLAVHITSICVQKNLLCVCSSVQMFAGVNYTISVYGIKELVLQSNCDSEVLTASWTKQVLVPGLKNDTEKVFLMSKELLQAEDENEIQLSTAFFNYLFASGSALLDTCVVLFSSHSGILFYYKLKQFGQASQTDSNILCSLGQPILVIHAFVATLVSNENQNYTTVPFLSQSGSPCQSEFVCMAVIGQNGKIMLIYQSKKVILHQVVILPGTIVACLCVKNNIYFSTNEMLYRGKLSVSRLEDGHMKFDLSVKRLGYCGISAFSSVPGSTLDGNILFCFSRKGRLYTVEDDGQHADKMTFTGTQMKDLILSIQKTDEEVDRVQKVISRQNDVLCQLSIASKLAALTAGHYNVKDRASKMKQLGKILKVQVVSKTNGIGSQKHFSVLIRLTNVSVAEFSSDWIFMVQLQHFQDFKQQRALSSSSKSLPLINGLGPGAVEEIEIPLKGEQLKLPVLTFSVYLVYNTHIDAIENRGYKTKSKSESSGSEPHNCENPAPCILISEQSLDVLNLLEVSTGTVDNSSISTTKVLARSDLCTHSEVVDYLAQKRPQHKLYITNHPGKRETSVENHSMVLHLDGKRHSILKKCENSTDVLRHVLAVTNIGTDLEISSPVVRVRTFGGCTVTLSVAQSQSESPQPSSNLIGYLLTIQGEDLSVVVLMRSAFLERITENAGTATVEEENTVSEVHVRNVVQTIKGISKRMEEVSMEQEGQSDKTHSARNDSSCLSLYKQLRNISFLPDCS